MIPKETPTIIMYPNITCVCNHIWWQISEKYIHYMSIKMSSKKVGPINLHVLTLYMFNTVNGVEKIMNFFFFFKCTFIHLKCQKRLLKKSLYITPLPEKWKLENRLFRCQLKAETHSSSPKQSGAHGGCSSPLK